MMPKKLKDILNENNEFSDMHHFFHHIANSIDERADDEGEPKKGSMIRDDAKDYRHMASLAKKGKHHEAASHFAGLDTDSREHAQGHDDKKMHSYLSAHGQKDEADWRFK